MRLWVLRSAFIGSDWENTEDGSGWGVFCYDGMRPSSLPCPARGTNPSPKRPTSLCCLLLNLFVGWAGTVCAEARIMGVVSRAKVRSAAVVYYAVSGPLSACGRLYPVALLMKNNRSAASHFGFVNPVVKRAAQRPCSTEDPLFPRQYLAGWWFVCVGSGCVNKCPRHKKES